MSTITNLQVKLYSTKEEEPVNPVNPDIPDTGGDEQNAGDPDTGLFTVHDVTNGQDNTEIEIAPIAFSLFAVLLLLAFTLPKIIEKIRSKKSERYDLNTKKFRNFRFLSTILASSSLLVGLVSAAFGYVHPNQPLDVDAPEKVTIDAPILDTNDIAVVHAMIKVPASPDGSKLYVSSNYTDLVDQSNPKYTIPTIKQAGQLTDNTYGVYVGKDKPTATSVFYPIYDDEHGLYSIFETASESAQNVDVWFGVRSKSNEEALYATDLIVESLGTVEITMQEMTPEICAELRTGVMDYTFRDTRDNKIYKVARYEDGNCWMTDTLDLDLSTGRTLTSADSDLPDGITFTPNINTSTEEKEWEYDADLLASNKERVLNYNTFYKNLTNEERQHIGTQVSKYVFWRESEPDKYNDDWTEEKYEALRKKYCEHFGINDLSEVSEEDRNNWSVDWMTNEERDHFYQTVQKYVFWRESEPNIMYDDWTESDYEALREKFRQHFGVSELTAVEKQWWRDFDFSQYVPIENEAIWNNQCDTLGDQASNCREEIRQIEQLLKNNVYLTSAYKNYSQFSFDTGDQAEGNFYNLFAATAGTAEVSLDDLHVSISATGSVCPANWHLATVSEFNNAVEATGAGVVVDDEWVTAYDRVLSHENQNFLPKTGTGIYVPYFTDDFFNEAVIGKIGVGKEAMGIKVFSFANLGMLVDGPAFEGAESAMAKYTNLGYSGMEMGSSVRCVANYDSFSLNFEGNTDVPVENLPETDSKEKTAGNAETGATFTIPETIPTREDAIEFIGWSTSSTRAKNHLIDYHPGDEIVIKGSSITLFASWLEDEPNPSPKAIHTENGYLTFVYDKTPYIAGKNFRTDNDKSSKILEVFRRDAFEEYNEVSDIDNMDLYANQNDSLPSWTTCNSFFDSGYRYYSNVSFDKTFKEYTPETLQGWFACAATTTAENPVEISFANLNTSKVKNAVAMFATSNIIISDIEKWDTSSLENASGMFAAAVGAEELNFSNWNTQNLERIDQMFRQITSMQDEEGRGPVISGIQNWDTSKVTNMKQAFMGATLDDASANLSKWNVSNVTDMSYMFSATFPEDKSKINTLNLYGWDTSKVTNMIGMFGYEYNEKGNNFDKIALNCYVDGEDKGCDTASWKVDNVTDMTRMFGGGNYTTIYATSDWSQHNIVASDMFKGSTMLIGGAGTTYSNDKTSIAYAKVDGGISDPGYFTNPYVIAVGNSTGTSGRSYFGDSLTGSESSDSADNTDDTTEPETVTVPSAEDEQTEPHGVFRRTETDKTDYALIIVTIISIALILLGALIIFLIEKRERDEDDDIEEY